MTRFSTRAPTPLAAIISELRQPSTPSSQVTALRCLKNEVIGHEQKKELCISLGVVECLEAILSRRNGNTAQVSAEGKGRDGEEAQLQTVTIVGSLAYGTCLLCITSIDIVLTTVSRRTCISHPPSSWPDLCFFTYPPKPDQTLAHPRPRRLTVSQCYCRCHLAPCSTTA